MYRLQLYAYLSNLKCPKFARHLLVSICVHVANCHALVYAARVRQISQSKAPKLVAIPLNDHRSRVRACSRVSIAFQEQEGLTSSMGTSVLYKQHRGEEGVYWKPSRLCQILRSGRAKTVKFISNFSKRSKVLSCTDFQKEWINNLAGAFWR